MRYIELSVTLDFLFLGSAMSSGIFGGSRSPPSKMTDRSLPPLVPPKLVEDDEDFDERDLDLSPANHVQLRPSYWAPTLETLAPEEAEFYRKALVSAMVGSRPQMKRERDAGRSMSMLRMGRSTGGGVNRRSAATDGIRRSMTMLRMGRAFDDAAAEEEEEAAKRSMGMLRMGRGSSEENFGKSMSMLRMGRRAMLDDDSEDQQQLKRSMGMLRMGRSLGNSEEEREEDAAAEEKRSMGMLRMGRRALSSKSVERGALNMLRMGKRGAGEHTGSGVAAADKSASSSSN